MELTVNGKPRDADEGCTVARLIDAAGLDPRWVMVELNGEPVRRGDYSERKLRPGDRLELVRAVAGG
jgi:thiamine biosynthesis protein ThiS